MNQEAEKTNGLNFLWLTLIVFVIDIVTKFVIVFRFGFSESVSLLPFLSITRIGNYGAAFGLFFGQRWPLVVVSLVICLFLIRFLYQTPKKDYLNNIGFSLVLGGAFGNLFDRLYYGYVIDFLDFHFANWHYPAFNIADSAVCMGVIVLLFGCFRTARWS